MWLRGHKCSRSALQSTAAQRGISASRCVLPLVTWKTPEDRPSRVSRGDLTRRSGPAPIKLLEPIAVVNATARRARRKRAESHYAAPDKGDVAARANQQAPVTRVSAQLRMGEATILYTRTRIQAPHTRTRIKSPTGQRPSSSCPLIPPTSPRCRRAREAVHQLSRG